VLLNAIRQPYKISYIQNFATGSYLPPNFWSWMMQSKC